MNVFCVLFWQPQPTIQKYLLQVMVRTKNWPKILHQPIQKVICTYMAFVFQRAVAGILQDGDVRTIKDVGTTLRKWGTDWNEDEQTEEYSPVAELGFRMENEAEKVILKRIGF